MYVFLVFLPNYLRTHQIPLEPRMRKLHDGAIETRSVLLGLLVIEHALQKGKRMLFEEGRQRLELLVAWLLKVVERHQA